MSNVKETHVAHFPTFSAPFQVVWAPISYNGQNDLVFYVVSAPNCFSMEIKIHIAW